MPRYQEYSTPAAITMALSKGFRDFMNIYSQEKADAERKKREDAEWKMKVGRNVLDVHNQIAENDYRERQVARQTKEDEANATYRSKMLELTEGKNAAVGFPSPEGVLGHEYLTGKIDKPTYYAELARVKATTKAPPAEKEPPDFVNLFSNMITKAEDRYDRGRNSWDQAHATDRLMGKDVPYSGEPPDVANLFKSIIEPRAGRLLGPQAVDSIRGEAANIYPELLPDEKPVAPVPSSAVAPVSAPAKQPSGDIHQAALQALQAEFGDEWNTASEAVRNAALARKIKELGG